ncbi:Solute carrier family 25 member 33, partial [Manacus vitellinus]
CGGTVGAIFTCPLEVIKTRLQSSKLAFRTVYYPQVQLGTISGEGMVRPTSVSPGLFSVLKSILEKEGPRSLFRGLGPNLVGVAPSRAVYFGCYSKAKEQFNSMFVPNSNIVHVCSAGSAAFITNSLMNPIWMVKTRMQLERNQVCTPSTIVLLCATFLGECGSNTYQRTISVVVRAVESCKGGRFALLTLFPCSAEVIRTRLREEGTKYKAFIQTARLVAREEGYLAFYRGLFAQLIRQIPNTAIVLSTYELIVYLLEDHAK